MRYCGLAGLDEFGCTNCIAVGAQAKHAEWKLADWEGKKNEGEKKDTATEGGTRFVAVLIMFI